MYADGDATNDLFVEQRAIIEELASNNLDCHVTVGVNFNVDFFLCSIGSIMKY